MKKILSLALAALLCFSMVACDNNNTDAPPADNPAATQPGEPSTNPDTPDTPETPTNPGSSDVVPEGEWVIKENVAQPEGHTPQTVQQQMTLLNGSSTTVKLYQSAWSKMSPDEVKAAIAPLVPGWIWSVERSETVYAENYSDAGWQRSYEYSVKLTADGPEVGYVNDSLTITFTGNSAQFDGWRGISVNYSTPDQEVSSEQQEFVLKVLELVYGKPAAEYLAYAPETTPRYNEMEYKCTNSLGSEVYRRQLDDRSVYFSLYAHNKQDTGVDKYAGNYQSIMENQTPEYMSLVFPKLGDFNFSSVPTIGAGFVSTQLNDYDFTEPSSNDKLYTYEVTEYNNGDKDVEFHADLNVRQKNTTWIETMVFVVKYKVEVRDGQPKVTSASIEMPAYAEDWDNNVPEDPAVIKRMAENLEKAKKVANAVFGTNFAFEDVYWKGPGDYKLNANYQTEMYGRTVSMYVTFNTKTLDSIGRNRSSFTINIY